MTTDPRRPTTEAVNSRLLILPFCMDAIVHKHAVTLRQLPGNIFDVGQSGSLGHYRPPSRISTANFLAPHYHNADCFNAFQKRSIASGLTVSAARRPNAERNKAFVEPPRFQTVPKCSVKAFLFQ